MKTKLFFVMAALVFFSCTPSSTSNSNNEVPTPANVFKKVGDTCFGGYVFKKISDEHGFIVINTGKSNIWDSAKVGAINSWQLPTCADLDTIISVQTKLKISFGISGIYWTNGLVGNKYQGIYENGHSGGPCYSILATNKIKIAYIRKF